MVADSISDFIIRLKNAGDAGKESVLVPYCKVVVKVADLLQKKGYIESHSKKSKKGAREYLLIRLTGNSPVGPKIEGVRRRSKPSKRVYLHANEIYPIRHGRGLLAVSTSSGIMSGEEARKAGVGGEALFEIW
jgi:small subunit ribosomal protein S8